METNESENESEHDNTDRKVYYTYRMFKKLTEERRWFTKLFVLLSREEWESCGKGILKFYQVDGGHLIDIKKKEDINKNIDNLYLIIDTQEVKDNSNQDLITARKHQNILKTREFDQNEVICFYNLRYGHNFSKDKEKVIRWCHLYPDNENQQIALSFNDEVALFHAWKIFCEFKNIPSQLPIPIPSADSIDDIIEDLSKQLYISSENDNSREMYIHFYSEDEFFTKKLFKLAKRAQETYNLEILKKVAKVITLLISFSSKPDIILQFINDKNYEIFFNCLKFIDGPNKKEFEPLLQKFFETEINNIFNIKDNHILETIKINYRIIFLKEILFPDLFTQEQSNDITNYLLLHGNNIIVYIIDNMQECFHNLVNEFQNNTKKASEFFHELSYILRLFSFPIIKDEFSNTFVSFGFHFLVTNLLIKKMSEKINEGDKEIIVLCLEVLKLICRDNCILLVEIFTFENEEKITILDKIIYIIDLNDKNIFDILIEMFRTLNLSIQKELNEDYLNFVIDSLIPKIEKQAKIIFSENLPPQQEFQEPKSIKYSIKIQSDLDKNVKPRDIGKKFSEEKKFGGILSNKIKKFLYFALEIFNQLFLFKFEDIQNCLLKYNILNFLNLFLNLKVPKLMKIYFCTYLKNIIDLKKFNSKIFDYEKTLDIFWQIFQETMQSKRYNLLTSLTLSLMTSISNSENNDFLQKMASSIYISKVKDLPLLKEIVKKAKLKGLLNDLNSKNTSESECSLRPKSEKSKNRHNLIESIIFEDGQGKKSKRFFIGLIDNDKATKIYSLNKEIQKLHQKDNKTKEKKSNIIEDDLLVKRTTK